MIAACLPRPIYFVAKQELFDKRWQGWLLNCLGAFPVRRGESDEESVETALALLARGQAVVIFPEGTRIRTGSLGKAKRGVGRLALESGAPGRADRADRHRARPPRLADPAGQGDAPLRPPAHLPARGVALAEARGRGHGAHLALRGAPVGVARRPAAAAQGRGRRRRLDGHGHRRAARARRDSRFSSAAAPPRRPSGSPPTRENERYLPGRSARRRASRSRRSPTSSSRASTSWCSPCRARACRPRSAKVGALVGDRSVVLVASKGLVAPLGTTPDRLRGRARARPRGRLPRRPRPRARGGRGRRLGGARHPRPRRPRPAVRTSLEAAGLRVEATDDVTGAELAACAKNAATLAAAAAGTRGANLAGAAAGRVFSEVHELALRRGGRSETFAGLAGAGRPRGHHRRGGQPQPARGRARGQRRARRADPRARGTGDRGARHGPAAERRASRGAASRRR